MSTRQITHNFFREGRRDALSEVRILRSFGQWTEEKRSCWIKEAVASRSRLAHTHPERHEGRAYFAGRLAALKSWTTKDFSVDGTPEESQSHDRTRGTFVYQPLKPGDNRFCSLFDCGSDAIWGITLSAGTRPIMVLCDACRQEWQRHDVAYSTPDGWDWDEDEEQRSDLSFPIGMQSVQRREDILHLGQIALPLAVFLDFDVTNLFYPVGRSTLLEELFIVALVALGSKPLLRLLFFVSGEAEGEMKDL